MGNGNVCNSSLVYNMSRACVSGFDHCNGGDDYGDMCGNFIINLFTYLKSYLHHSHCPQEKLKMENATHIVTYFPFLCLLGAYLLLLLELFQIC